MIHIYTHMHFSYVYYTHMYCIHWIYTWLVKESQSSEMITVCSETPSIKTHDTWLWLVYLWNWPQRRSPLTSRWGAAVSFVPHQRTAAGLNEPAATDMELSLPPKSRLPPSSGGSTEVRGELHKSERTSFRKTHQVQIKKSQLIPRFHVIDLQISLLSYPDNFHVWTLYFLI